MAWKAICVLLAFSMTAQSSAAAAGAGFTAPIQPGSDVENLRRLLRDHFGTNRHHVTNPKQKYVAKSFIYQTFKDYGLQMVYHLFVSNSTKFPGVNFVGRWPGRYTDTPRDKPLVLMAHYDTSRSGGGVDDNGSGLAALLESARLITSQPCLQDHTIDFVAVDLKDQEISIPDAACWEGNCGSRAYVTDMLLPYLQLSNIEPANVGGAFVLDSILNYNSTEGSQGSEGLSDVSSTPGISRAYENVQKDNFRGNFIGVLARESFDYSLYGAFDLSWTFANPNPKYKFQLAEIPIKDVAKDGPSSPYWPVYQAMTQFGDHYSFWTENPDLKAVLITDTGVYRGRMSKCYHLSCDNLGWISDDNLGFLKKTTDVVSSSLLYLAGSPETCPDPVTAAPDAFKKGFVLKGTVDQHLDAPYDITFRVDSFSETGLVRARVVVNEFALSTKVVGRFDSVSKQLKLRLTEPQIEAQWDMDDVVKEMAWAMEGRVTEIQDSLLYVGTANWGPRTEYPQQVAFNLFATDAATRAASALPSVLGTLCVLLFAAVVAMGGWIIYKRVKLAEPFSQDQASSEMS